MAKTTAPLLSFGATGQIAKSMVYSKWRGVPYSRRYVTPANPRTAGQQLTRGVFSTLNQFWSFAPAQVQAAYDLYATGRPFLGRNRFIGDNVKVLRADDPENSMAGIIVSPGARGGLPPAGITATDNAGDIEVTFDLPEIPSDWTLDTAIAIAFVDQPANQTFNQQILVETAGTPGYDPTFVAPAAGDYVVAGFLEWTKPNGDKAYSRSLATTVTI